MLTEITRYFCYSVTVINYDKFEIFHISFWENSPDKTRLLLRDVLTFKRALHKKQNDAQKQFHLLRYPAVGICRKHFLDFENVFLNDQTKQNETFRRKYSWEVKQIKLLTWYEEALQFVKINLHWLLSTKKKKKLLTVNSLIFPSIHLVGLR